MSGARFLVSLTPQRSQILHTYWVYIWLYHNPTELATVRDCQSAFVCSILHPQLSNRMSHTIQVTRVNDQDPALRQAQMHRLEIWAVHHRGTRFTNTVMIMAVGSDQSSERYEMYNFDW